jgi:hypothetical protein
MRYEFLECKRLLKDQAIARSFSRRMNFYYQCKSLKSCPHLAASICKGHYLVWCSVCLNAVSRISELGCIRRWALPLTPQRLCIKICRISDQLCLQTIALMTVFSAWACCGAYLRRLISVAPNDSLTGYLFSRWDLAAARTQTGIRVRTG